MTADAVQWKLHNRFVRHVMELDVMLEIIDIVNWLRTVKTFSRNHFAMLKFVLREDCEWDKNWHKKVGIELYMGEAEIVEKMNI